MCLFPFIYKSCLCPRVMTPYGGTSTLTCRYIAAGKADVWAQPWRKWLNMANATSVTNMPFLTEQLPILSGMGQTCRYTVHCQAKLQHIWGLLNRPAEITRVCPSPGWQWDGEVIACSWRACQAGVDEEWAWESHSWPLACSGIDIAP